MPAAHATLEPFARPRPAVRRPPEPPTRPAPRIAAPAAQPAAAAAAAAAAAPVAARPPVATPAVARRGRLWSNTVAYAAAAVIVLCAAAELAPWLSTGSGAATAAVFVGMMAVLGASVFAYRYVAGLRSHVARLRRELDAARETERWHRAVVDEVAEAVLVASPEGRLLETNQAAWALLGQTRDELSGRRLWDLLPLDDRVVALRRGELVATHGGGLRRLLRPDGSAVLADVSWSTLADGRVIYLARPFK